MRSIRSAVLLAALLAAPMVARADGPQDAAAQVRFGKGRELFLAHKYADALVEFRAANELLASPNTRLYIARCERELGRPGTAYVELQRAASEAADRARLDPKYTTTRDTAKAEAAQLEGKFGRIVIKAKDPAGLTVTLGGTPLPAAGLGVPTPMDPGAVEVVATAKGKLPFKQKIAIKAGETTEVGIALDPDPAAVETPPPNPDTPPPKPNDPPPTPPATEDGAGSTAPRPEPATVEQTGGGVRTAGLFVIAAGVAGFAGFAVMAAVAQSTYDQLRTLAKKNDFPPDYLARAAEGERNQNIANVMLGVGIGCAVVGGIMFAAGGPTTVTRGGSGPQTSSRTVPILSIGPSGGYVGVVRAF